MGQREEEKLKLEDKATSPRTERCKRIKAERMKREEGVKTTRCNLSLPPVSETSNQINVLYVGEDGRSNQRYCHSSAAL